MKGSQVSREAWNQERDVLVTHLPFISCDHELGLGPGVEDTALSGTRWALIRHTFRKHGGKRVVCQEKGKRSLIVEQTCPVQGSGRGGGTQVEI